jgi:type I restriction enzyme S subunit
MSSEGRKTETGGRDATRGVIPGRYALSVGDPQTLLPDGWRWTLLTDAARLETGHTPARKEPSYWGGDIPWIGIRDATSNHGRVIHETKESISEAGLANSSARLLPEKTVCLSRTASVGYVVVMGQPMATSQDFVNWVCGDSLDWRFLVYMLMAERDAMTIFASGTTHQTIYFPEVKAFHIALPSLAEQRRIAWVLGTLDDKIELNQELSRTLIEALEIQWARSTSRMEMAPLSDFANQVRKPTQPSETPAAIFEQFSIPAFDDRQQPEICLGESMASGKTQLPEAGAVLISKLNPETWRAWLANPSGTGTPVCSPEFIALTADSLEGRTWISGLALFDQPFRREVLSHSTGTTGSRQRVKPGDVLACSIPNPDPAALQAWFNFSRPLFERNQQLQDESRTFASIRDELLPKLISGKIRVPEGVGPDLDEETATEVAEELAEA